MKSRSKRFRVTMWMARARTLVPYSKAFPDHYEGGGLEVEQPRFLPVSVWDVRVAGGRFNLQCHNSGSLV